MINISLHNADSVDLFASAVDNNQPGSPTVFPNQRLNSGATSAVFAVQEDGSGSFSITTTVADVNDPSKTTVEQHSGSSGDSVDVRLG
jgi:hypothetical protein